MSLFFELFYDFEGCIVQFTLFGNHRNWKQTLKNTEEKLCGVEFNRLNRFKKKNTSTTTNTAYTASRIHGGRPIRRMPDSACLALRLTGQCLLL